jgi:hypothetical protein
MQLVLVAESKTNAKIAAALFLSEKTARKHVSTILQKLDLTNQIEAVTYAVRMHARSSPAAGFLEERRGKPGGARSDLSGCVGSALLKPPCDRFHK